MKEEVGDLPLATRVVLSSCIMGLSLACTASVDDVSVVWGFLGSTCGVLLSYVLPAASYLLLRRVPTRTAQSSSVPRRKLAAALLLAIGLVLIPVCVYNTVVTSL